MTTDVPADPVAAARAQADAALAALRKAQEEAEAAVRRAEEAAASATATATAAVASPTDAAAGVVAGPLPEPAVAAIRAGYGETGSGAVLELGALVNGDARPDVPIRIPLAMTNRHGLIAGATGTGKTRTLQLLAEQL